MAITDLNATLLPNEKLTLVGPGRVEFIGTQPEPGVANTAAAGAKGATATPAAIKGGTTTMTTTALTTGKAASAATAQGVVWKGTGWSLGLGLGLGPLGTAALGALLMGGGYYLYKRRRTLQKSWPF
ncbi:MAG: hypothetical protein HQL63_15690 [Magnetococcales bacterium]|nr:hypothetical protein [Magnetococcales bacterium]